MPITIQQEIKEQCCVPCKKTICDQVEEKEAETKALRRGSKGWRTRFGFCSGDHHTCSLLLMIHAAFVPSWVAGMVPFPMIRLFKLFDTHLHTLQSLCLLHLGDLTWPDLTAALLLWFPSSCSCFSSTTFFMPEFGNWGPDLPFSNIKTTTTTMTTKVWKMWTFEIF